MKFKCISTGSDGNAFVLTNDQGHHLLLEAGIPLPQIKRGLHYDIENLQGCVVSHSHLDHSLSVSKIRKMGIPMLLPYKLESKRLRTMIGDYIIETFPLPHNGVENRGFLITSGEQTVCFMTDFEYCPYDLTSRNIDTMIIEMNYQADRISDMDEHRRHVVLGHSEEKTTIEILKQNIKSLKNVIFIHMSNSGSLDRELAMKHVREVIPEYITVEWANPGKTYNISLIPF